VTGLAASGGVAAGARAKAMSKMLYVTDREGWREWLARHHSSEREIWLIYYKKHAGKPRISYEHAVEEALCFGWIDSIVKKIDERRYAQKFTPRRDLGKWSASNRERMRRLVREGRMTDVGLAKFDLKMLGEEPRGGKLPKKSGVGLPRFVREGLMAKPKAWEFFQSLAPSYRRLYVQWIVAAKKEETRKRRLEEAVSLLQQKKKLGLK
jgi:uncharacterized protein YdeI (YjbR/CyaY-like superfamily)